MPQTAEQDRGIWRKIQVDAVREGLSRIARMIYDDMRLELAWLSLDKLKERTDEVPGGFTSCRRFEEKDFSEIERRFGSTTAVKFAARNNGQGAYLLIDNKQIIGYAWSSGELVTGEGRKPFLFDVLPKPKVAYCFDAYILKEMRKRHLAGKFIELIQKRLREQGFGKSFYLHDARNIAMKTVASKAGFRSESGLSFRRVLRSVSYKAGDLGDFCDVKIGGMKTALLAENKDGRRETM
jgi:hypothetical protein